MWRRHATSATGGGFGALAERLYCTPFFLFFPSLLSHLSPMPANKISLSLMKLRSGKKTQVPASTSEVNLERRKELRKEKEKKEEERKATPTRVRKTEKKREREPVREEKAVQSAREKGGKGKKAYDLFRDAVLIPETSVPVRLLQKPKKERNPAHINIPKEEMIYQADVLYLPKDDGFKFALVVVDVADGTTDVEPLKRNTSAETAQAFQTIFRRGILPKPHVMMQVDNGSEFKKDVKKYFEKEHIILRYGKPGRSRQQAFAEQRNFLIARMVALLQTNEELITKEPARAWTKYLPQIRDAINRALERPLYKPSDEHANLPLIPKDTSILEEGTRVRILLDKPADVFGKTLSGYKFRATDIRFDPDIKTIVQVIIKPDNPILYKVSGVPRTAYTREQLLTVDDESPPVKEAQNKFVIEKFVGKRKKNNKIEYLVRWRGYSPKDDTWESRISLENDLGVDSLRLFEKDFVNSTKN